MKLHSKEYEESEIKLELLLALPEMSIEAVNYSNISHRLQVIMNSSSTKQKKIIKTSSYCFDGIIENIRNGDYEMRNL